MKGRGYHLDAFHGNDGMALCQSLYRVVGTDFHISTRFVDLDFRTAPLF